MAKRPNFDFERREREKAKSAKRAEKAKAKGEKTGATDRVEEISSAQKILAEMDAAIADNKLTKE